MKKNAVLFAALAVFAAVSTLAAEENEHWGMEGSVARCVFPKGLIGDLPGAPNVSGAFRSVGLMRFSPDGTPQWGIAYNVYGVDFKGTFVGAEISGRATLRGVAVTKYAQLLSRRRIQAGLGFGAGMGRHERAYHIALDGNPVAAGGQTKAMPLFHILGYADIKLGKRVSVGPVMGMGHAFLAGVSVKVR